MERKERLKKLVSIKRRFGSEGARDSQALLTDESLSPYSILLSLSSVCLYADSKRTKIE